MHAAAAAAAAKSLQSCLTLCNHIDDSPPAPGSLRFSRQELWRGLQFHSSKEPIKCLVEAVSHLPIASKLLPISILLCLC